MKQVYCKQGGAMQSIIYLLFIQVFLLPVMLDL